MIRAEIEGRCYTPPPPSSVPPPSSGALRSAPATMANSRNASASKGMDDWGDWGDSNNNSKNSNGAAGGNGSKFSSGSEYTRAQLEASAAGKESYFARKMVVGDCAG